MGAVHPIVQRHINLLHIAAAGNALGKSRERQQHHIVLILAEAGLAFAFERPHHRAGKAADADGLAQRLVF